MTMLVVITNHVFLFDRSYAFINCHLENVAGRLTPRKLDNLLQMPLDERVDINN